MRVSTFKEKPRKEEAERLIESGGLWNSGVFAFKIEYLLNILLERGYPIQYEQLVSQYHLLPQNSFDYEVAEKAEQVIALSYTGSWKDLGTWNTLTEEMQTPISGKGFVSKGITNSHIVNELDIPITLIGLNDVVVAASPDGILVTNKEDSLQVKEILKDLIERPMFEERRWGWYKVLEHTKYLEGNEVLTKEYV